MAGTMDSGEAHPSRRGIEVALTGVIGWIALRVLGRFAPKLGLTSSASDTEVLLETAAIVALAYGLWRGSRACALLLFFVLTPTAISALISSSGRPFAALGYAAVSVAVFLGIPATLRLHARGAAGPPTLRRKIFVALAVAGGAGILALLVALGYLGKHAPPLQVVYGAQIPRNYVEGIRELGVLEPGEKVRFFYSTGVFDFRDGMYVQTDRRLVLANPEWSEPLIDIPLEEVRELD
ncbi:MAG TPA: hypothetical protein VFY49_12370, partial [Myxococcota bacterium]|nr:hypothetical protein [Myxococcota bacterium]